MARRRRTSGFEDLVTVLARLPWWVCLVIALIAGLVLHSIAIALIHTYLVRNAYDMSGELWRQMVYSINFAEQH